MQQNQRFLQLLLTIVSAVTAFAGKAQFAAGISVAAHSPAGSVSDKLPFVRTGMSLDVHPGYTTGRLNINSNIGYQALNTHNGMRALAKQYNYTSENGYSVVSGKGGLLNLAVGAAFNLLPAGNTACGVPKPSLLAGAQLGWMTTTGKIDERIKNEVGEDAYVLRQTGKSSSMYYYAGVQMILPVNSCFSLTSSAGYNKALDDFTVEQKRNGVTTVTPFSYSDMRFSIGVQVAFKSINEKGIKRQALSTDPNGKSISEKGLKRQELAVNPNGTATDGSGEPVALVAGQPIGGIIVKGGKNPGGNLLVLDNGKSISEKGLKRQELVTDPNGKSISEKGLKRQELVTDPNGKSITEKGLKYKAQENINSGDAARTTALTYTDDFVVEDKTLLSYLGVEKLVIEKGEYAFDYSSNPGGSVRLKVQAEKIIHRDIAARAFVFDGVDAAGNSFSYTIEPVYANGAIKELQVNYKSINEKGIK